MQARRQAEADRAATQLRRAGRTLTAQDSDRSFARDTAERKRQWRERAREDDARER